MTTEGEPGSLVKIVHLLVLSASWGMQFWMTFIAGRVLFRRLPRHTFGLVQSKLFPYYSHAVLCCCFLNLVIYTAYHPRELLSPSESAQMALFFSSLVLSALNARWFSPTTSKIMFKIHAIEREHGLGGDVGFGSNSEGYQLLREQDPKYGALRRRFLWYHGISALCNLILLFFNGANLGYIALILPTL